MRSELTVEQIRVPVQLIRHLLVLPFPPYLRKQPVFLHDSIDSLVIYMGSSPIKPYPNPSIAIGAICFFATLTYELYKAGIRRALCSPKIRIVPASRNLKERTHCYYGIFIQVFFYRCKLDLWSHILPAA